jgi:hypothetical protein
VEGGGREVERVERGRRLGGGGGWRVEGGREEGGGKKHTRTS